MKLLKQSTQLIELETEVAYVVLPETEGFPEQIDIKAVFVYPKVKKARKRDVLNLLTESQLINLEDAIFEERKELGENT